MSALALELLNQLPNDVELEIKQKSEERDKIKDEMFKAIPVLKYTKFQIKQIKKQETEVTELISQIKNLDGGNILIETYEDVISKPLCVRYTFLGSSIKIHEGYLHFIETVKKLILYNKIKHSNKLKKCVKF